MKISKIILLLIVKVFICNIAFSKELVLSDYHQNPLYTVIMSHKRNDVDIANYISGQGCWFNKDPLEWDDKDFDKVDKYIKKEKLSIDKMVGLSIKDILTYIYNMKQFDCIQVQNVDNQNRAIVQFQNCFKTINLVFYFDKSTVSNNEKPNSCIVIIVGANKKAIDEFIGLYDNGMYGKNVSW